MELNEQQEKAANHFDGPALVIAVPGSGKTRLLTERVARLIENKKVKQSNIVCVTFTNKSADEMKERVCTRLGVHKPACFVGTFHRLCSGLLRKFGHLLGYSTKFTILDADDQKDLIKQIARQMEIEVEKGDIGLIAKLANDYRENIWTDSELEEKAGDNSEWALIVKEYIGRLRKSNLIDFSGLLSETIRLLEENKDILGRLQDAMRYVLVDEAQDTNVAQFRLIDLFSAKWNNVMLTGDISQSIYRFRGSRYQNILDFLSKHPNCERYDLSLNYRSTPEIIEVADRLIKHNSSHLATKFETENESGEQVRCLAVYNQFEEAEYIARQCKRLIEEGDWDPKDIAILYRMNSMSETIERTFANYGLSYKVIGGFSFYNRKEIKDCLSMLRFSVNPKDGIAFHRVASLFEGVGDTTIGKIETMSMDENISLLDAAKKIKNNLKLSKMQESLQKIVDVLDVDLSNLNVRDCLEKMLDRFKYDDILDSEYPEDCEDRKQNVQALLNAMGQYVSKHPNDNIESYLQMISLLSSSDEKSTEGSISLMTMHAAKGLEFPIVFMPGVEDGILPHTLAIQDDPFEGKEEERRLCYVGMTRAKTLLIMTYCRKRKVFGAKGVQYNKDVKPSPFLFEAGLVKKHEAMKV